MRDATPIKVGNGHVQRQAIIPLPVQSDMVASSSKLVKVISPVITKVSPDGNYVATISGNQLVIEKMQQDTDPKKIILNGQIQGNVLSACTAQVEANLLYLIVLTEYMYIFECEQVNMFSLPYGLTILLRIISLLWCIRINLRVVYMLSYENRNCSVY